MRKILTLAVVVAATLFVVPAQAQIKFGLKGGLNITDMSFSSDVLNTSNRTGFFIGPTVKFTLPLLGFVLMRLFFTTSARPNLTMFMAMTMKSSAGK